MLGLDSISSMVISKIICFFSTLSHCRRRTFSVNLRDGTGISGSMSSFSGLNLSLVIARNCSLLGTSRWFIMFRRKGAFVPCRTSSTARRVIKMFSMGLPVPQNASRSIAPRTPFPPPLDSEPLSIPNITLGWLRRGYRWPDMTQAVVNWHGTSFRNRLPSSRRTSSEILSATGRQCELLRLETAFRRTYPMPSRPSSSTKMKVITDPYMSLSLKALPSIFTQIEVQFLNQFS